MPNRALPLERIDNFRDYGCYAIAGGRRLREGLLYRSAHHCDASANDLQILSELGIATVIDLRGPGERAKAQCRRPDGFGARIVETNVETGSVSPHLAAVLKGVTTAGEARAAIESVIADMPCRPAIISALRGYFIALAEANGPTVIHCASGKDRTGVAVALLHATLGVHHDDIIADYLLTNTIGRLEERMTAGVALMRKNFGPHLSEEAARALVTVEPRYLEAAFASVDQRFGGLEPYLRDELGIDAAWRETLAQQLVV
jgi:protein-tyrosine phosphatase